jgi:transposase-like protein
VLGRLKATWKEEFDRWQQRDLSARRYVYIWADGVYLQARMEVEKQCILVLIGATPEGRKELIGFQTGFRESAQSWTELLTDLKSRGLSVAPERAIGAKDPSGRLGILESAGAAIRHGKTPKVLGA